MVIEGEMPGSAPPMMPQTTPAMAANAAGVVVSAVQAWANISMGGALVRSSLARGGPSAGERPPQPRPDAGRQGNAEQADENQVVEQREADRQKGEPGRRALAEIERGGQHQQDDRRQVADRADHG